MGMVCAWVPWSWLAPRLPHAAPAEVVELMWIVEVALRRPYTFLVMALLILLATPLVLLKMSTVFFPEINIPVISIVWTYTGLSPQEIGNRITAVNERTLTTTVNDTEHIDSHSFSGFSFFKICY